MKFFAYETDKKNLKVYMEGTDKQAVLTDKSIQPVFIYSYLFCGAGDGTQSLNPC
jgi:hypothetical protein